MAARKKTAVAAPDDPGKKGKKEKEVEIVRLSQRETTVAILGEESLILNRPSEKAKRQLLFPATRRKSQPELMASLKHNPVEEYRAAPYTLKSKKSPTLLALPSGAFKKAIGQAALDVPGAFKNQIGRLTWVAAFESDLIPVYGIPKIGLSVVRSADMSRTPDVRTRVFLPRWAVLLQVSFVTPNLTEKNVLNLLAAAGLITGVGDWRQEKGSGSHGRFRLVSPNDPAFLAVLEEGGRAAQEEAMENPEPYDAESEELLTWFTEELTRRLDEKDKSPKAKAGEAVEDEGEE